MQFTDISWTDIVTVLVTSGVVIAAVLIHYEGLSWFGRWLTIDLLPHRARIAALIFGQLGLHIIEIWLFAAGYYLLLRGPEYGAVVPAARLGFLDLVYFSAITYTTVGFGDFVPTGAIRFMTGMEALIGFLLLGWSAAFTFVEMQRYWGRD
jgi:hypothetical protein